VARARSSAAPVDRCPKTSSSAARPPRHQPHARAIQQTRHQVIHAVHALQHRAHLGGGKHHRQALRPLRASEAFQPRQLDPQHLAVKEQQRRQRLILRRCRHLAIDRQIGQKRLDLERTHFARMAFAVEQDEAPYPEEILTFRADGSSVLS